MSQTSNKIVLDLTAAGDIYSLKEDQNIQQDAYARVRELVIRRVKEIEDRETAEQHRGKETPRWIKPYTHGAIAVLGSRGSGKTTFILNALQWLEKPSTSRGEDRQPNEKKGDETSLEGKLCALGVIDPTVQEQREHGLLKVLALVDDAVQRRRKKKRCDQDLDSHGRDEKNYDTVCSKLRAMSKGLRFLDGLGKAAPLDTDEWEDDTYLLTKGLTLASEGQRITELLDAYLSAVCTYLEVQALVLAFDDVDTNFEHGWPLLEMLRKYLVSPRLIVLVSGNLELFSLLVRRQQWLQLKELAQQDERSRRAISSMVDELESQYLLKLLRSERRVELLTLAQAIQRHEEKGITVKLPGGRPEEPLYDLVLQLVTVSIDPLVRPRAMLDGILATTRQTSRALAFELLARPVRLIVNLLLRAYSAPPSDPIASVVNPLGQAFSTALMQAGVSLQRLSDPNGDVVVRHAIDYLIRSTGRSPTRLLLDSAHDGFEVDLVVVAALVARFRSSPGLALSYWLRAGGIRSLLTTAPKSGSANEADERRWRELAQLLINSSLPSSRSAAGLGVLRMSLERGRVGIASTPVWGSVAVIMDRRRTEDPNAQGGKRTIGLVDLAPIATEKKKVWGWLYRRMEQGPSLPEGLRGAVFSAKGLRQRLESVRARAERRGDAATAAEYEARSFAVNAVIAVEQQRTGNGVTYVSIWRLLDLLVQIVNGTDAAGVREHSLEWARFPALQLVSPGVLTDVKQSEVDDHDVADEEADSEEADDAETSSVEARSTYRTWLVQTGDWSGRKVDVPPSFVLDRMWDRLEAAVAGIEESARDKKGRYQRFPGWWVYRHIVALWQAVLVEECRYRSVDLPRMTSVTTSSKDLVSNLESLRVQNKSSSDYPFFAAIFSHPLWAVYLPRFLPDEVEGDDWSQWKASLAPERELVRRYEMELIRPHNPSVIGYAFDVLNLLLPWGGASAGSGSGSKSTSSTGGGKQAK